MRVIIISRDAPKRCGSLVPSQWPDRSAIDQHAVAASTALDLDNGEGDFHARFNAMAAVFQELSAAGLEDPLLPPRQDSSKPKRGFMGALADLAVEFVKDPPTGKPKLSLSQHKMVAAYKLGVLRGTRAAAAYSPTTHRDWEWPFGLEVPHKEALPLEQASITCNGSGSAMPSPLPSSALLFGHIVDSNQFCGLMNADGGASWIHILRLDVARDILHRHGDGIIEEGMYLLHPKRENVIVPFKTFHADMLAEMTREARVVMGRIGAKTLIVDTVEGVTFGGEVVSRIPLKSGSAKAEYESNSNRRVTYEWGSPTFDPDSALKDCVWIQDNAGVMTIVDQRKTSNLTRYEEFSKIDTSFKLSIDIMKLFATGFQWAETSTYRYEVQFFDKSKV